MLKTETLTNYNSNAADFNTFRKPNPELIKILKQSFFSKKGPILSIGCGTGGYEKELSKNLNIIGFDKSWGMLSYAKDRLRNILSGDMINLPFKNSSFSGVFFIQSLHHLGANLDISSTLRIHAKRTAILEAIRVIKSGQLVIIQRDPSQNKAVWFWKYFPKAIEKKLIIQTKISEIVQWLIEFGMKNVTAIPIEDMMIDNFFDPYGPLKKKFRNAFSEFSYLSNDEYKQGIKKLENAIKDESVHKIIEHSKRKFKEIGGTVFVINATK